jgi:hypothetical protein
MNANSVRYVWETLNQHEDKDEGLTYTRAEVGVIGLVRCG